MEIKKRRNIAQIVKGVQKDIKSRIEERNDQDIKFLSSGCTLLNLALTDNPHDGFQMGRVANIIGDSSAGKSMLCWTLLAEAVHDKRYEDYRFIYDDAENALSFDVKNLFGRKVNDTVEYDNIKSDTIEDFHDNVLDALKGGKKIIYCLDSFDSLTSEAELKRDIREGSYRMEKPKMASEILRKIKAAVKKTDSLLIIISQTRDNIGVTFGSKKTRSGGKALKFYSTHELWLAIKGHISKMNRDVGVNIISKISKNRVTGKLRKVEFPIYFDYGVDNILACINFLIEEKVWRKSGKLISTKDFPISELGESTLIERIEDDNLEPEIVKLVHKRWQEIEEKITTKRKSKYEE